MNSFNGIGNVASDVELKAVGDDNQVATFLVAFDRQMSKEDQEKAKAAGKQTADFIRVSTWNGSAKSCSQYLSKGSRVGIEGRIRSRSWDAEDGTKRSAVEIAARSVTFLTPRAGDTSEAELAAAHTADASGDDIPF